MKLKGAIDRAAYLKKHHNADFNVGVEGGIAEHAEQWLCFSATVILDNDGEEGISLSFPNQSLKKFSMEKNLVPSWMNYLERATRNNKVARYFTKEVYMRKDQFIAGTVMALCPFQHEALYFTTEK